LDGLVFKNRIRTEFRFSVHPYILPYFMVQNTDCVMCVGECMSVRRQQSLFHVLAAYSVYNTEVGYCQGMSQLAALLLMYMNEEVDKFQFYSECYTYCH